MRELCRRDGHEKRIVALFVLSLLVFKVNRIVDIRIEKGVLAASEVLSLHDDILMLLVAIVGLLVWNGGANRCQVKETFVLPFFEPDGTISHRRDILLALPSCLPTPILRAL